MTTDPTDTTSTQPATPGKRLALEWLAGRYAVCRLDPGDAVPEWALAGRGLTSATRTEQELSVVAPEDDVPQEIRAERGWRAMRVVGPLEFSMVGVLAMLTGACADAGVPLLVVSTYETDIVLVQAADAERAVEALRAVADVSRLG